MGVGVASLAGSAHCFQPPSFGLLGKARPRAPKAVAGLNLLPFPNAFLNSPPIVIIVGPIVVYSTVNIIQKNRGRLLHDPSLRSGLTTVITSIKKIQDEYQNRKAPKKKRRRKNRHPKKNPRL